MTAAAILVATALATPIRSALPLALLHPITGQPMLRYLLAAGEGAFDRAMMVVGPAEPALEAAAAPHPTTVQVDRLGATHAALKAAPLLEGCTGELRRINRRAELARAEVRVALGRAATEEGATLMQPASVPFWHDTRLGQDVTTKPSFVFCPDVTVEYGVEIRPFPHLEGSAVGRFAQLRPRAVLGEGRRCRHINRAEGCGARPGAKVNYLSYLGDAWIGAWANIATGAITCNYDGVKKYRTESGAGAFVSSDTALIAPVCFGARALVGAGSVITADVPADVLAIACGRQTTKPGRGFKGKEG
jgi:bifunctional UDP-N-acetylglucosamine pyrophosphorylase/glucosamine-1-phosphate N-acetyltransferase